MTDAPDATALAHAGEPDPGTQAAALARAKLALGAGDSNPRTVGRYELGEPLGAGGMGVVYRAFDPQLRRAVAVKLLRSGDRAGTPHRHAAEERLVREARAIAALSHPNVVAVYDAGSFEHGRDHGVFVVMELVEGSDVSRWRDATERSRDDVIDVFLGAGAGLGAAHDAGIVHRDFKPANVLVDHQGRARVLDFGLATHDGDAGPTAAEVAADDVRLTAPGAVMGTPAYMAPEQHDGAEVTPLADQFAFCVSLYEALLGRLPYPGKRVDEIAALKRRTPPGLDALPPPLRRILLRGLSPDPSARFPEVARLLAALGAYRRRHRRRAYLGAGLLAVVGSAAAVGGRPTRACDEFRPRVEQVWNDEVRTRLEASFARHGDDSARSAWHSFRARIDQATDQWAQLSAEACAETSDPASARSGVNVARTVCLEREYSRIVALLETFEGELQPEWVRDAAHSTRELLPARCRDAVEASRRDDPGEKARDALIIRAAALISSSRYEEAETSLERAVTEARDASDLDGESRALYQLGRIHEYAGRRERSAGHYHAAGIVAERGGHWQSAFRAHARHMSMLSRADRIEEAKVPAAQCERLLGLHRMPAEDLAGYHYNRAIVASQAEDYLAAHEWLDRAEPPLLELYGAPSGWSSQIHNVRATILRHEGRHDDALDEFARMVEDLEASRPDHRVLGRFVANYGAALSRAGRLEDGVAEIRRGLALHLARPHDSRALEANVRKRLGLALARLGEFGEARRQYEIALDIARITDAPRDEIAHREESLRRVNSGLVPTE